MSLIWPVIIIIVSLLSVYYNLITVPNSEKMADRQLTFITINTVFAGFSFTALGLLLGLSSEKLIERIKNTSIVMDKVKKILISCVYFIVSVIISMFFILGLDKIIFINKMICEVIYVLGAGTMIVGIGYFICCVYELYDLVRRIYDFNKDSNKQLKKAMEEAEKTKQKLHRVDLYNDE